MKKRQTFFFLAVNLKSWQFNEQQQQQQHQQHATTMCKTGTEEDSLQKFLKDKMQLNINQRRQTMQQPKDNCTSEGIPFVQSISRI